ncbi:HesA/MoeB/ThiF family protein [Desulfotruncus alcoholivorax]|uniref:HesA/MoeB/ThiF family protein n=1 Tax=Desulfotruncus alcoholivorax TaxID=265477 RepID=UPI001EE56E01|nr:HesA/MoeB/ThiF family protein [Desulfotruncus alcoholivorax]
MQLILLLINIAGEVIKFLTADQMERYRRNMLLDGVGVDGQKKLLQSSVLVAGSGGLGSPVAYYLAAAGIGHIGLLDGDTVDLSNLQRQILHFTPDLGRPKVVSAREKISALNPDIKISVIGQRMDEKNYKEIISQFDLVVDGTDNFEARFLINRACVEQRKPYIFGGVLGYSGQVMTIIPGQSPCLSCIFRHVPSGEAPSCDREGVLGAIPGLIGTLEVAEAIKVILNIGEPLIGRLLTCDVLTMQFMPVEISRDPDCPVCGGVDV